jgi:outer membrane protein OmpA-like peptidoglycan-associated protein
MNRFLLASAASVTLAGAAFIAPALAQLPSVPATPPPVQTPQPEADVTADSQIGTAVQAPDADAAAAAAGGAEAQTDAAGATAQTDVTGDAQAQVQAPDTAPAQQAAEDAAQQAQDTAQGVAETTEGAAAAATPDANVQAGANVQTPAASAQAGAAAATPANASAVCQPRTTSVDFGARGSALSLENRNTLEHAVDAASVCTLQSVTIVDSAQGRLSARRAQAVRSTLIRQGVPADRITVSEEANADAEAGQLDVRMAFAGVANAGSPSALNEEAAESPSS